MELPDLCAAHGDEPKTSASGPGIPLADVIYQAILDSIYQGELPPGSVVNEALLAHKFGVSRGPVREAVRRLQGIQLVTREPYTKARIVQMDASTAQELFQLRMALEGMACYLATQRISDAEIDILIADLERNGRAENTVGGGDTEPYDVFDFHESIVRACGNSRIISALCEDLYHLLRIYRRHSGAVMERKEDAYKEHWQILRAMKARDAALAESLMRLHIERAARNLSHRLNEDKPLHS